MFRKLIDRLSQSKKFPLLDDAGAEHLRDTIVSKIKYFYDIDTQGHWGSTFTVDVVDDNDVTYTILVYRR